MVCMEKISYFEVKTFSSFRVQANCSLTLPISPLFSDKTSPRCLTDINLPHFLISDRVILLF